MGKIFFYKADRPASVKDKKAFRILIDFLFRNENRSLDNISYIFCSDEYLLNINQQYLNHDTLTDVITFPFSKKSEPVSGEVYMSVDRIKENAKMYKTQYQNELERVMLHGALHLCGYTDKNKSARLNMREKENYYLNQLKVSREANN